MKVVVKKSNIAMLVVRLVNPLLGLSRFKIRRWMAKPSTNGRLSVGTMARQRTFDHIVIESGRRIYTMICVVVTGILVGANNKLRQEFVR